MFPLPEPAHSRLAELGTYATGADIAVKFRQMGLKGKRSKSPCLCPVAKYLNANSSLYISVGPNDCGYICAGQRYLEPLPSSVAAFTDLFDRGFFPDLVEK